MLLDTNDLPNFVNKEKIFNVNKPDPDPASDIARAPMNSPEQSFGKYFSFWASVPLRDILKNILILLVLHWLST